MRLVGEGRDAARSRPRPRRRLGDDPGAVGLRRARRRTCRASTASANDACSIATTCVDVVAAHGPNGDTASAVAAQLARPRHRYRAAARSGAPRARARPPRRRTAACRPAARVPGSPPTELSARARRLERREQPARPTDTTASCVGDGRAVAAARRRTDRAYLREPVAGEQQRPGELRPTPAATACGPGDPVGRRVAATAPPRDAEQRGVDLAAHGVAHDADGALERRAKPPRDRVERAHAVQRRAEPVREPLRGRHADPHAR